MSDNIWKYGLYDLDKDLLFTYMQKNVDPFLEHYGYNPQLKQLFIDSLSTIKGAITNNTLQSKDGFGSFIHDPGIIKDDEITKNALYFLHKVATGYGSKLPEKKITPEEKPVEKPVDKPADVEKLEGFDYSKHGLASAFNRLNNPFGNDSTYKLWKLGFADQQSLDTALADFIKDHREKILASKYDYTLSPIDLERYSLMLTDLETDLRNGIQDSDKSKLEFFGFNPDSFILNPEQDPPTDPPTDPTVDTKDVDELKSKYGNLPIGEYLSALDKYGIEGSDKLRMASLLLDVGSILMPGPVMSMSLGLASDTLNLLADEMDGINDTWLDDIANYGLSILGGVPFLGKLSSSGKFIKKLIKGAKTLGTIAGTTGMAVAITNLGLNYDQTIELIEELTNGNVTVDNVRTAFTLILLILGGINAGKSAISKGKADAFDAQAQDAITVKVKDSKGKTKKVSFGGLDKTDLEALRNNPVEFQKYIQENFKDLGDILLADVTTHKAGSRQGIKKGFKKRTADESVVNYEADKFLQKGNIPWVGSRARYFMENKKQGEFVERVTPQEAPKTETPKTEEPKKKETKSKKKARKLAEEREQKKGKKNSSNKKNSSKTNSEKTSKPEKKPTNGSEEIVIPPGRSDERTTPASEIKPDTKSEAQKINEVSRREKLKKAFKGIITGTKETAVGAYKAWDKFMDDLLEYKLGGVLKAQTGTKIYGNNFTIDPSKGYETLYSDLKKAVGTLGNNDFRKDSGVVYKNSATLDDLNDLEVYTSKFLPYANDETGNSARRQDLYNFFTEYLNKGHSLEDILGDYNNKISSLYDYKRNEGLLIGENNNSNATTAFNKLHRALYKSANSADGVYGYDEDMLHINGTTTLQRGPDRTQEEILMNFDDLADDDVLRKALGNRKLYKTKSGHYYLLNSESAPVSPKPVETPVVAAEGVVEDPQSNLSSGLAVAAGLEDGKKVTLGTPPPLLVGPKPVAPYKPVQPFFTTDKALLIYNYYRHLRHNKEDLELARQVRPLIYDILQYDPAPVVGDLQGEAEGLSELGKAGQRALLLYTTDLSFNAAVSRQYYNDALEFKDKKFAESSKKANQIEAENRKINATNKENRYNIAMKNLENVHQTNLDKLQALVDHNKANLDSGTNIINQGAEWIQDWNEEVKERQDSTYARKLANYVYNTPENYIPGFDGYFEKIWNKSQTGETLTATEQRIMAKIREQLITAYEIEKNGETYNGYGIQKPEYQFIFAKSGGKLWCANKESLMDMYNHIKLQKRK